MIYCRMQILANEASKHLTSQLAENVTHHLIISDACIFFRFQAVVGLSFGANRSWTTELLQPTDVARD